MLNLLSVKATITKHSFSELPGRRRDEEGTMTAYNGTVGMTDIERRILILGLGTAFGNYTTVYRGTHPCTEGVKLQVFVLTFAQY